MTPETMQQKIEECVQGGEVLDVTIDLGEQEFTERKTVRSYWRDASGTINRVMFDDWSELNALEVPAVLYEVQDDPVTQCPTEKERHVTKVSVPEINERFK